MNSFKLLKADQTTNKFNRMTYNSFVKYSELNDLYYLKQANINFV